METKTEKSNVTALSTESDASHDSRNGLAAPAETTVPEATVTVTPIVFTVDDLVKAVDNTAAVLGSTRKEMSSRSLINALPTSSRDIPVLLKPGGTSSGFGDSYPTRLQVKKFNSDRTLIIYDSQKGGKGYEVLETSDIAEKFFSSAMELAEDRYKTFIDISTSRDFGNVKIPTPGLAGLNIEELDVVTSTGVLDVNALIQRLNVMTDTRSYRLRMPAIMTDWEAETYNFVRSMTLENDLTQECQERMDSMRRMMSYDPRIQPLAPQLMTGEFPLTMATGYNSQLWSFPNVNQLLTTTAMNYLPLFSLTMRSNSSDLVMLGKNNQRSDIATVFSSVTASDANQLDMMRIVAAMIFPQQIQLVMDTSDSTSAVDMLGAILSKLFLSTSALHASIDAATGQQLDGMIGKFLTQNKYMNNNRNSVQPLDLVYGRNRPSDWHQLSTDPTNPGQGWINHNVRRGSVNPQFDHDYARIISVPQYGDIDRTPIYEEGNQDVVRLTDTFLIMQRAANESTTPNMTSLSSILNLRKEAYIGFLAMLNDYIYRFTYNSFRAPQFILNDFNHGGANRLNDPIQIVVKPRAFVALWKYLPSRFHAPMELLMLPEIESKIETEYSIFQVAHDHVRRWVDRQNLRNVLKRKQVAQIAAKVSKSDIMAAVVATASGDPYNERLFRDILINHDEIESPFAQLFDRILNEVIAKPELVGYTYDFAWKTDERRTYKGTIQDLRDASQIVDNVQDWQVTRRLDMNQMIASANSGRFISDVLIQNNADDGQSLIGFEAPIPVEVMISEDYDREHGGTNNVIDIAARKNVAIEVSERLTVNTLTDRYTVPSLIYSQYPDAHRLTYPAQNDWFIGPRRAFSLTLETVYQYLNNLTVYSGIRVRNAISSLTQPRDLERSAFIARGEPAAAPSDGT